MRPPARACTWSGAVVAAWLAAGLSMCGPAAATGPSTPAGSATSTSAPLTVDQWKSRYEPAVGQLADDALVVWDTGSSGARRPTTGKVRSTVAACRRWHDDATTLPGRVPAIPLAAAERAWRQMVSASVAASSACVQALRAGSKGAIARFRRGLALVHTAEGRLAHQLDGTAGPGTSNPDEANRPAGDGVGRQAKGAGS
ncbi:MAG TPA: hypothetical protein VHB02_07260 [Acidimicrobiales bacterium]|nr:hypothetical protein [Acidimicrobiales bacterium]